MKGLVQKTLSICMENWQNFAVKCVIIVGVYQEPEHYEQEFIPCSECDHETLRPHIVWFGEVPFEMGKIQEVVSNCEVFISIGTSGHVYPAAGLIEIAKSNSAHCIGVNLESPLNARYFDEFFKESGRDSSFTGPEVDFMTSVIHL